MTFSFLFFGLVLSGVVRGLGGGGKVVLGRSG